MPWIPARPSLQKPSGKEADNAVRINRQRDTTGAVEAGDRNDDTGAKASEKGKHLGGVKTTPVRAVEAGPFIMEVWVEEGKDKDEVIDKGSSGSEE